MAGMRIRRVLAVATAMMIGAAAVAAAAASPAAAVSVSPLKGYRTVVGPPVASPAGKQSQGLVQCPAGTVPLGGGVFVQSSSLLVSVNSSFPFESAWVAEVNNGSATATTFRVRVICAAKPAKYVVVQRLGLANPTGKHTTVAVTCPAGTKPLSGGAASNSESVFVTNSSTAPTGTGWQISENNADSANHLVSVLAVCGNVTGYAVVHGPVGSVAGHSTASVGARCPAGRFPTGGGAVIQSASVGTYLSNTAFGASQNWTSVANNTSAVAFKASSTVVCAQALT